MRKLFLLFGVIILFVSLLGANNAIVPAREPEKAVPGKSFGAGKGFSGTSTDKPVAIVPKPEVKIISESKGIADPLASGGSPEKSVALPKMRALSDVIDSLTLPNIGNTGNEWNGRYIYIIQNRAGDTSIVRVFDPETGSIEDQWVVPFLGYCMGIAFVNNSMYVSNHTNGMIRKVDPETHALLASFPAPGGTSVRGITSDGENLYIGVAGTVDSLYLTDTLGSVLDSWDIGTFCDFVFDMAYASRDSSIWLVNDNTDQIQKVDISGPDAVLLEAFSPPGNMPEGISFDGSDLWFNTYNHDKIYRIDAGYSRSRIALFQDEEPWEVRSIKDILYENGIPFKVFSTYDIGNADLSIYTKAVIAGDQDRVMGDSIAAYRTWWENWISNGGVLQISGATQTYESWEGLTLPGDFSLVNNEDAMQDELEITSSWHPLVNDPYYIDDASLDDWDASSHGYLTGLTDHYTVITDTLDRPVLAIKRLGDGGIIATMMTLEFAWGDSLSPILENVIKYWQYGVTKNVLFALADVDQPWMRNALMSRDSLIGNVDYMNIRIYSPLLEDLNMYDVVLARTNDKCLDSAAVGDTLAAYVDLGGKVIVGCFAWYGGSFGLSGAIMDPAYNPFYTPTPSSSGNHYSSANLGWYDAAHSMMDEITTFSEFYRDSLQVNPEADTVAKYDDGEYLLGYKINPSGGLVVGFNAFVNDTLKDDDWTGQMVKLLSNIIDWSAAYSGIEEITGGESGFGILEISSPILTGKEWLTLSIDSPTKVVFRIINIAGMVVSSTSLDYATPGIKRVDFDVSKLPSGMYFLSLKTQKGSSIKKAMIIR